MAAMLEEQHNKSYLHKNKTFFSTERNSIVFLLQHGRSEHTLLIPHAKGLILTVTLSTQQLYFFIVIFIT